MFLAASVVSMAVVSDDAWIRSQWTDQRGHLEVAARRYEPVDVESEQPAVWLIGVTHIGDAEFYTALDDLMDGMDLVVYESVLPPGGTPPEHEADKAAATLATAELLASLYAGLPPADTTTWTHAHQALRRQDARLGNMAVELSRDGWGVPWHFSQDAQGVVWITSLGADGRPGGVEDAADIQVQVPAVLQDEDNGELQRSLANMLELSFQLDALDYGEPSWVPGDLRIDQVAAAFEARGESVQELTGLMSGTGLSGRMVHGMLKAMPMIDALFGGRVVDTFRVVLIEMLGQESLVNGALGMYGDAFREVIIDLRNEAALAAMDRALVERTGVEEVGVLYGGGHMAHMAELMQDARDYQVVETRWFPAISFDVSTSPLSSMEVSMLRNWIGTMGARMFAQ